MSTKTRSKTNSPVHISELPNDVLPLLLSRMSPVGRRTLLQSRFMVNVINDNIVSKIMNVETNEFVDVKNTAIKKNNLGYMLIRQGINANAIYTKTNYVKTVEYSLYSYPFFDINSYFLKNIQQDIANNKIDLSQILYNSKNKYSIGTLFAWILFHICNYDVSQSNKNILTVVKALNLYLEQNDIPTLMVKGSFMNKKQIDYEYEFEDFVLSVIFANVFDNNPYENDKLFDKLMREIVTMIELLMKRNLVRKMTKETFEKQLQVVKNYGISDKDFQRFEKIMNEYIYPVLNDS